MLLQNTIKPTFMFTKFILYMGSGEEMGEQQYNHDHQSWINVITLKHFPLARAITVCCHTGLLPLFNLLLFVCSSAQLLWAFTSRVKRSIQYTQRNENINSIQLLPSVGRSGVYNCAAHIQQFVLVIKR